MWASVSADLTEQRFQGSPGWSCHSFLGPNNIPLLAWPGFCSSLWVDRHLGCSHFLFLCEQSCWEYSCLSFVWTLISISLEEIPALTVSNTSGTARLVSAPSPSSARGLGWAAPPLGKGWALL